MIKSTKTSKISAVFLAAVLTAGIIALSSPSFMTGADAFPYSYDNDYKNKFKHKPTFDKSFGKSSAEFKKCININLNFPGLNVEFPQSSADTLAASSLERDGPNNGPNGGHDGFKKFDKDGFVCINANDNSVRGGIDGGDGGDGGDGAECEDIEQCFIDAQITLEFPIEIVDLPGIPDITINSLTELCALFESLNNFGQISAVVELIVGEENEDIAECIALLLDINIPPGGSNG